MISFQEAVQKHIKVVKEKIKWYESHAIYFLDHNYDDGITNSLARYSYYRELLEALQGVERLEKAYQRGKCVYLPGNRLIEQWEKEKK